jgi:hypothetical protein
LQRELGLEPEPLTRQLYLEILQAPATAQLEPETMTVSRYDERIAALRAALPSAYWPEA